MKIELSENPNEFYVPPADFDDEKTYTIVGISELDTKLYYYLMIALVGFVNLLTFFALSEKPFFWNILVIGLSFLLIRLFRNYLFNKKRIEVSSTHVIFQHGNDSTKFELDRITTINFLRHSIDDSKKIYEFIIEKEGGYIHAEFEVGQFPPFYNDIIADRVRKYLQYKNHLKNT